MKLICFILLLNLIRLSVQDGADTYSSSKQEEVKKDVKVETTDKDDKGSDKNNKDSDNKDQLTGVRDNIQDQIDELKKIYENAAKVREEFDSARYQMNDVFNWFEKIGA